MKLTNNKTPLKHKYHLVNKETPFVIVEAFKTARANLMFSIAASEKKPVVFTSCNQSEGKSTNCVNVALSFAEMGSNVLIIDADLRRPTVHKYFKLKNDKGLSTVLGYFSKVHDCIKQNVRPNLDVMTSGAIPPNPTELLSSKAMGDLLDALSEYYDYIFIDSPPVNVVTDSQLLNKHCAGMVFIIKRKSTTHTDIKEALRRIKLANGKVLGFITIADGELFTKSQYKYSKKSG